MFQGQTILRIPGPTPIPPSVERAMSQPMIGHRSGDFSKLFAEAAVRLKRVFQTEQDVLILGGSGTAGLEAAIANTVNPGDTVLVCHAGNFGERFVKIAKSYGANVLTVEAPWGEAIAPQEVAAALAANPEISVVFATQSETSTGVQHDIEGIASVVRATDALLVVDAVSSLGAVDLPMDAWGVDIVVTGSQKAFMLPPGLCFVALSERAWQRVDACTAPRFYFDLRAYRKQLGANTTPYTPAVSLIFGLGEVLSLIEAEGLQNVFDRHLLMSRMVREAGKALGLKLFNADEVASPTVTSFAGEGFEAEDLRKVLRTEFGITIAGGQGHLKGKIFRIGHMGYATALDMLQVIAALELALVKIGVPITLGSGVQAAQHVYLHQKEANIHA
jgi:aspartate aminotransferase-like enzyme